MEAEQACGNCTEAEEIDPLRVISNVAAAAARAAAPKRKAENKAGRDVCWVDGCECTEGLVGVPSALVADASHIMQHEMNIDFGKWRGRPRELPKHETHNKLCPKDRPTLPEKPIMGASVLIQHDGKLVPATIIGLAPVAAGRAGRGARAARAARAAAAPTSMWRAQSEADPSAFEDMATPAVWRSAELRATYNASIERKAADLKKAHDKKINALEHQVRYHRRKGAEKGGGGAAAAEAAATEASPPGQPDQATAGTGTAPPPRVARVDVTTVLPPDWQPGDDIDLPLAAGYVPRSREVTLRVRPHPDAHPGKMASFRVELPLDPPPSPPVTVVKAGRKAADARRYVAERSKLLGLAYSEQPNSLNPIRAWPLRETLSFANLRPEFFELPERASLFKKLFGFDDWASAMLVYEALYTWDPAVAAKRKREETAILHPRFQYLAALLRMRQHEDVEWLAAYFGVRPEFMSEHIPVWIKRLGKFAKENLVFLPKDFKTISDMIPEPFTTCGLGSVVAIGDCTDILTEDSRDNKYVSNQSRSDKSKHSAAMGLTWVSPNGMIIIATDLFLGRTSEHEACKACLPALNRIPAEYALMYDKGVSKLRVHLKNLNHVITPCYLRMKASRFTIEQGIRNRGVTCCRYVVEVPFSNMKAWKFLGGVVPEEDKYLLNDVWWWTMGFHNLKHHLLKPPAGV